MFEVHSFATLTAGHILRRHLYKCINVSLETDGTLQVVAIERWANQRLACSAVNTDKGKPERN